MHLSPEVRDVVTAGRLAHMVTVNEDGSPQVSIVWVGLDGDTVVSGHLSGRQRKLANLRRDPRIAISIEAEDSNEYGLQQHVILHGTAEVTEGGAPELLARLAKVYLGPDAEFPPMPDPPPGYVVRTTVDRVGGLGPWGNV